MTCGLSENELFILNMLYTHRNFNPSAGLNSKLMRRIYIQKYSDDFEDVIKNVINKGYVGPIKKKDMKYYISNKPKAIFALHSHGYPVILGRVRPL
ncbi:MAG: hypothetical protein WA144_08360 [Candidatus Methanoperedens sp.]